MDFWIQASNPRHTGAFDKDDKTLDEAIETVFPLRAEVAIMKWKKLYIPLSYKYDLSFMMRDILSMLERIIGQSEGELQIHWPSNTFLAIWKLYWDAASVKVEPTWFTILGGNEDRLNSLGTLEVDKSDFISEWKNLLECIKVALETSGYTEEILSELKRLRKVCHQIPQAGLLYR